MVLSQSEADGTAGLLGVDDPEIVEDCTGGAPGVQSIRPGVHGNALVELQVRPGPYLERFVRAFVGTGVQYDVLRALPDPESIVLVVLRLAIIEGDAAGEVVPRHVKPGGLGISPAVVDGLAVGYAAVDLDGNGCVRVVTVVKVRLEIEPGLPVVLGIAVVDGEVVQVGSFVEIESDCPDLARAFVTAADGLATLETDIPVDPRRLLAVEIEPGRPDVYRLAPDELDVLADTPVGPDKKHPVDGWRGPLRVLDRDIVHLNIRGRDHQPAALRDLEIAHGDGGLCDIHPCRVVARHREDSLVRPLSPEDVASLDADRARRAEGALRHDDLSPARKRLVQLDLIATAIADILSGGFRGSACVACRNNRRSDGGLCAQSTAEYDDHEYF